MESTAFLLARPVLHGGHFLQAQPPRCYRLGPRVHASPMRLAGTRRAKAPKACIEMPAWKRVPVDADFAKNEQLKILEEDLENLLQTENFVRASEVQDKLTRLQSGSFVAVLSANLKFYSAINKRSLVDMAGCWMQRGDVMCKFPFSELVTGYMNVINHFGFLFTFDYNPVEVNSYRIVMRGSVGYVTCEEVVTDEEGTKMTSYSTNIFEKHNGQWYIVHYTSALI